VKTALKYLPGISNTFRNTILLSLYRKPETMKVKTEIH
jgi:hypothetical protein